MVNLDSKEEISKIDKGNILGSIKALPKQVEQTWSDFGKIDIPNACFLAKNVVVAGMGGSALGARVIDSLFVESDKVPIEIFNQYHLPKYVNKNTLVILSSYSGNTEEVLSDAKEALSKGAIIFGITTGGKLQKFLEDNNLNRYIFSPKYNPSNQPRMALGYSIISIMAILSKCGYIKVGKEDINSLVEDVNNKIKQFDVFVNNNSAKKAAKKLKDKIPIIVSSEHLVGSAHAFKNQLNENAKTFSVSFEIPELNHHLMEGLSNPPYAKDLLNFIFYESRLYSPRVIKRFEITKKVLSKIGVEYITYKLQSNTKLKQAFELLIFGSFVQFYLSMLYGNDPSPIPWVDYFKKKLSRE